MIFIIHIMAVWRISSLFVLERGPWRIFQKIRERVGIPHDQNGKPFAYPDGFFAELLSCIWCTSLWVGAAWALLILFFPTFAYRLATCFALSTGAIVMDAIINRINHRP